jgi:nitrogen regulatory protein P-II 1
MKQIRAIIRTAKLQDVKDVLDALPIPGMMVWEIVGHGKQKGVTGQYRGREFKVDFLPKTRVEIVVEDSHVDSIINAIVKSAGTGQIGDGKIFISTVDDIIRIRTGERGKSAIG